MPDANSQTARVIQAPPFPHEALQRIRIVIVDSQPVVRQGLAALLGTQDDFDVVGEAGDATGAVRLVRHARPDIVFVDVTLPGFSDVNAIRDLTDVGGPSCKVMVFTSQLDQTRIVDLLKHGARAVVEKDTPIALIFKSVRRVYEGEMWIGRKTMEGVFRALLSAADPLPQSPRDYRLTRRERTILRYVVEGDTNKGVAERLAVSEDTVKHHLTSIFNKTGVSNRLELALFALHHRLVTAS